MMPPLLKPQMQQKQKQKYNELAKQLQACTISGGIIKKPVKLKGTVTPVDLSLEKTQTIFDLPTDSDKYTNFHVWLLLEKSSSGEYTVKLKIGEITED